MEPNLKNVKYLHDLYLCGMGLGKLAKNYGRGLSRQSIHYYFQVLGFPIRPRKVSERRSYRGKNYTRDKEGFWRKTSGDRKFLSRQTWEDAGNIIPNGYAIIYLDGNKDNCDIVNLSCVPLIEFGKLFSTGKNQYSHENNINRNT